MKKKFASRGPDVDTEKCVNNTNGNRFQLVLVAAQRAREIRRRAVDDSNNTVLPCVSALLEIQEGKINPTEYLNKLRKR